MTIYTFTTSSLSQYRLVEQDGAAVLWRNGHMVGALSHWSAPELLSIFYYGVPHNKRLGSSTAVLSLQVISIS